MLCKSELKSGYIYFFFEHPNMRALKALGNNKGIYLQIANKFPSY